VRAHFVVVVVLMSASFAQADRVEQPQEAEQAEDPAEAEAPVEPPDEAPPETPDTPATTAAATPARPGPQPRLERLTDEERAIYHRGYPDPGRSLGGVILSVIPGFGVGHLLQGRWLSRGWIFTLGQIAAMSALIYGHDRAVDECEPDVRCSSTGVKIYAGGFIAFAGFWVGSVVDAYLVPKLATRRWMRIHRKAFSHPDARILPYVVPSERGDGGVAGLALRF
jgi:hypothetical protein